MSPRTRQQNEQLREDRRREIRQAAVTLFASNGFDGTSTADIARAAGVSQPTIFVYFPSKEALFREAVVEPFAPSLELVRGLLHGAGSPRERVEMLARVMLASYSRQASYLMLVQYVSFLRDRFPAVATEVLAFVEATTEALAAVIAEGQAAGEFNPGDPRNMALLFYALIHGCGNLHPAPPEDPFWDDAVTAVLRQLTRS